MPRAAGRGAPRNAASIGQKIRQAREARGLTQEKLAESLGVTQTAVSYWEAGRRAPDVDDLVAIAELLDTDIAALFAEARPRRLAPVVLRAVAEQVLLEDFADEVDAFSAAADELELPRQNVRIESGNPKTSARELLKAAGVKSPPVPVDQLARLSGVRVLGWRFDDAVSGLLLDLESGPAIGFNEGQSPGRRRFTIAHELGHFLLRHHDHFHIDLAAPASHGNPPGYDWRDERAANEFAAELLMPAEMVIEAYARKPAAALPKLFDVSQEAMGFRLVNLGLR